MIGVSEKEFKRFKRFHRFEKFGKFSRFKSNRCEAKLTLNFNIKHIKQQTKNTTSPIQTNRFHWRKASGPAK